MAEQKTSIFAPPIVKVATFTLNQWALDFKGNEARIADSVRMAKKAKCTYRLGPELEITGYSCEDHFYEIDTIKFSWKCLGNLLNADNGTLTNGILCDFSMPVLHNGVRYNCRVFCLNKKILLIRPKMWLADDGNYREDRWFTAWSKHKITTLEDHTLPEEIQVLTGQKTVKFGVGIIEGNDATIASEVCEELFTPESPNIMWGLEGVDIISNGSASHFQLGKLAYRHQLIKSATARNGGIYMYSNMSGCDGNRLVFDGNSMIYKNGALLACGDHLTFKDVEMVTATINLDEVRSYRSAIVSRGIQADQRDVKAPRIMIEDYVKNFRFTEVDNSAFDFTPVIPSPKTYDMEDEMGLSVSRYLWDYLCRSSAGGFFLPLSGGVDSSSTAMLVFYMCTKILEIVYDPINVNDPNRDAKSRLFKLTNDRLNKLLVLYPKLQIKTPYEAVQNTPPLTPKKLMNVLLHTCNMPTKNNTAEIKQQATELAIALGSYHITAPINNAFIAIKNMVSGLFIGTDDTAVQAPSDNMEIPRYKLRDGDWQENLAIQNIQARLRMMTAYYLAQILPLYRWNHAKYNEAEWLAFFNAKQDAIQRYKATQLENLKRQLIAKLPGGENTPKHEELQRIKSMTIDDIPDEETPFLEQLKKTEGPNGASVKIQERILRERPNSAFLLVLASSNADEALRGFYTKYDASSADINPIGSFSKTDLRKYLRWSINRYQHERPNFDVITRILDVTASPELTPTDAKGAVQDDEIDIELTYEDLYELGLYRKRDNLGPLSMFQRLCKDKLGKMITYVNNAKKTKESVVATPTILYEKINTFFKHYGKTRSKMPILTPSIHATNYSPDDNRFDQRPFLYPFFPDTYQMEQVKALAKEMEKREDVVALIRNASGSMVNLLEEKGRSEQVASNQVRRAKSVRNVNQRQGGKTRKVFRRY